MAESGKASLVIVDNSLVDFRGHSASAACALSDAAAAANIDIFIVGCVHAVDTVKKIDSFLPLFSHDIWWHCFSASWMRKILLLRLIDIAIVNLRYFMTLRILKRQGRDRCRLYFCPCTNQSCIYAWLFFVLLYMRAPDTRVILHFLTFAFVPGKYNKDSLLKFLFRLVLRAVQRISPTLVYSVESDKAKSALDSLLLRETLLLPSVRNHQQLLRHSDRMTRAKSFTKVRVGILGEVRTDKNTQLLMRQIEFVSQPCELVVHDPLDMLEQVQSRKSGSHEVTIIKGILDFNSFYELLSSLDILVLPYDQQAYEYRTSGLFAEAQILRIPCVVPQDTWMADQLKTLQFGVIYDPTIENGLANAISFAINNREDFSLRANAASARMLSMTSAIELFGRIATHRIDPTPRNGAILRKIIEKIRKTLRRD